MHQGYTYLSEVASALEVQDRLEEGQPKSSIVVKICLHPLWHTTNTIASVPCNRAVYTWVR